MKRDMRSKEISLTRNALQKLRAQKQIDRFCGYVGQNEQKYLSKSCQTTICIQDVVSNDNSREIKGTISTEGEISQVNVQFRGMIVFQKRDNVSDTSSETLNMSTMQLLERNNLNRFQDAEEFISQKFKLFLRKEGGGGHRCQNFYIQIQKSVPNSISLNINSNRVQILYVVSIRGEGLHYVKIINLKSARCEKKLDLKLCYFTSDFQNRRFCCCTSGILRVQVNIPNELSKIDRQFICEVQYFKQTKQGKLQQIRVFKLQIFALVQWMENSSFKTNYVLIAVKEVQMSTQSNYGIFTGKCLVSLPKDLPQSVNNSLIKIRYFVLATPVLNSRFDSVKYLGEEIDEFDVV